MQLRRSNHRIRCSKSSCARDLAANSERYNTLAELISNGVSAIHRRGCLIKDMDSGLLDFYALNGDRLVFLCWKLGEKRIAHWHGTNEGFSSRKPLDERILGPRSRPSKQRSDDDVPDQDIPDKIN